MTDAAVDTGSAADDEARGSKACTVDAADDMGGGADGDARDGDTRGSDLFSADAAGDTNCSARWRAVSSRHKLNAFAICMKLYELAISSYVKKPSVVAIFSGGSGGACLLAPVAACQRQFLNAVSSRKNSYASAMSLYV